MWRKVKQKKGLHNSRYAAEHQETLSKPIPLHYQPITVVKPITHEKEAYLTETTSHLAFFVFNLKSTSDNFLPKFLLNSDALFFKHQDPSKLYQQLSQRSIAAQPPKGMRQINN